MIWKNIVGMFYKNNSPGSFVPVVPMSVSPASVPDAELAEKLDAGRAILEHRVVSAQSTVSSMYHQFASRAASNTRR